VKCKSNGVMHFGRKIYAEWIISSFQNIVLLDSWMGNRWLLTPFILEFFLKVAETFMKYFKIQYDIWCRSMTDTLWILQSVSFEEDWIQQDLTKQVTSLNEKSYIDG
jgi:hypothetical protein